MSSSVYNNPSTIDGIICSQPGSNYVNPLGSESSEGKASKTINMTEHDDVKDGDDYDGQNLGGTEGRSKCSWDLQADHDMMFVYFEIHGFSLAQADAVAEGLREKGYAYSGKQVHKRYQNLRQANRAKKTLTPRVAAPRVAAAKSTQAKTGGVTAKPKAPAASRKTAVRKSGKTVLSTTIVTSGRSGPTGREGEVVEPAIKKRKRGPRGTTKINQTCELQEVDGGEDHAQTDENFDGCDPNEYEEGVKAKYLGENLMHGDAEEDERFADAEEEVEAK